MRVFLWFLGLVGGVGSTLAHNGEAKGVEMAYASVVKYKDEVYVKLNLVFKESLDLTANRGLVLTPVLIKGEDSLALPKIKVEGRRKRIYSERNKTTEFFYATVAYKKGVEQPLEYLYHFPYREWMDGASIEVFQGECRCNRVMFLGTKAYAQLTVDPKPHVPMGAFEPALAYVRPEAKRKEAVLEGSAFLTFPQGRSDIVPELGENAQELEKIYRTCREIEEENQAVIDKVTFYGYASPEGSYGLNAELAKNRVLALKGYVEQRFNFKPYLVFTDFMPENWRDLRKMVVESDLPHRGEIVALIDGTREPDNKEWVIKSTFPEDYRFMLEVMYPKLRRTDYAMRYTIRSYSAKEAVGLLKTKPSLLNLNEMYLVAQMYEPGTAAFNEVFELAVRMFPQDEVANLNAANIALSKGDLPMATGYLKRVNADCGEALNALGVKAMLEGAYDEALLLLKRASDKGVKVADENITQIRLRLAKGE